MPLTNPAPATSPTGSALNSPPQTWGGAGGGVNQPKIAHIRVIRESDLEVGDVFTAFTSGIDSVVTHYEIVTIEPPEPYERGGLQRRATVKIIHRTVNGQPIGTLFETFPRDMLFHSSSVGIDWEIVAGPKIIAANADPALVRRVHGSIWEWVGEKGADRD